MSSDDLKELGAYVAHQQDALLHEASPDEAVRRKLAARAAERDRKSSVVSPWRRLAPALVAGAMGMAGGLLVSGGVLFGDDDLTFSVGADERPGVLSAWETAPDDSALPIGFSDGTVVRLAPQARARVVQVGSRGADIVIEAGRARIEVVPHEDGEWRVRTGPFVVEVHGTEFDVSWDPQKDRFELSLFEGRVVVRGCTFGEGQAVEAGQRVSASCSKRQQARTTLDEKSPTEAEEAASAEHSDPAEAPSVGPDEVEPASPKLQPVGTVGTANVRARKNAGGATWQTLAQQGHYRRAYSVASAAGFEAELGRASAEQALTLGDAARLSGRAAHARHAYESVRARFPGTEASSRAAFALGRATGESRWFETYLSEQPRGPLASAALGRLFEGAVRSGSTAQARPLAARYLAQFPSGPHADQARELLSRGETPPNP